MLPVRKHLAGSLTAYRIPMGCLKGLFKKNLISLIYYDYEIFQGVPLIPTLFPKRRGDKKAKCHRVNI